MIVVMVVVSTAAVIIIVFGDGLPAVFVEYHTDLIHNQNLLLLGGGFINRLHQHIHHVMDGIDRGQGTCQILHCQLSGLGRQGVEVVSCFCNKRIKEGFLFLCGCGRKLLRDIEMEQFIVQITEEAFADEFLCHENLFGIRGEVGEGACLLQGFIFFLTDGICFINDGLNGCLQLLCEGIQISRFFSQSQLIADEIADDMIQIGIGGTALCDVREGIGEIEQENQGIDIVQDAGEIFLNLLQCFKGFLELLIEICKLLIGKLMRQNHALLSNPFCEFGEILAIQGVFLRTAKALEGFQRSIDKIPAFACKSGIQRGTDGVIIFIPCHIEGDTLEKLPHVGFLVKQSFRTFHKGMAVCKEQRPFHLLLGYAVLLIFAQGNLVADKRGDDVPLGEIAVDGFVDGKQTLFQLHAVLQRNHAGCGITFEQILQTDEICLDFLLDFLHIGRDFIGEGGYAFFGILHGTHEQQQQRADCLLIDIIRREISYFFF